MTDIYCNCEHEWIKHYTIFHIIHFIFNGIFVVADDDDYDDVVEKKLALE